MARVAHILKHFETLERHFDWLVDGSGLVSAAVKKNFIKEVGNLDAYLRSLQREDVNDILNDAAQKDSKFPESGNTCTWIGIFRAAELVWRSTKDFALFRMEEEGLRGSSPQIVVKEWNRYVHMIII